MGSAALPLLVQAMVPLVPVCVLGDCTATA